MAVTSAEPYAHRLLYVHWVSRKSVTEHIHRQVTSHMQSLVNDLVFQTSQVSYEHQWKENQIGQVKRDALPLLTLGRSVVEQVKIFNLLRVYISDNLKWAQVSLHWQVASKMYFLKQLKRASASTEDQAC